MCNKFCDWIPSQVAAWFGLHGRVLGLGQVQLIVDVQPGATPVFNWLQSGSRTTVGLYHGTILVDQASGFLLDGAGSAWDHNHDPRLVNYKSAIGIRFPILNLSLVPCTCAVAGSKIAGNCQTDYIVLLRAWVPGTPMVLNSDCPLLKFDLCC